ncbi:hypothetical protein BZG02_12870 [Labilibaculum filiforme]|uniref:Uncharacterized protein n=1 Tax=Labilibaculum filiforme TaxID=1940526 RepID=A0A2N3HVV2_9BACT|nr:hypothetical protein [Labilibaculum filiforme]PKQ62205.1 hypothetical protein BZG02_12870 [Labilibaculum filiforme]
MASFNYTVDTKPMAEEMRSVSRHVNATTGAVVAMQTAVIIAEEKAADHVCNNVNKGFYSLIRSQISQKMAKLQSEVDSHLMQLVQQKNALLSIKNRMQKDYNMIASRYIKLFNGLNSNLKQRVFELDKPTIDFAVKEVDKVSNRSKYLTATIPIAQLESLAASQKIVASNVKYRGFNVIKSMRSFLFEMNTQKKLTDQILINDGRYTETATVYIPIVICECNRDKTDAGVEISVSEVELDNISKSAIKNTAFAELNQIEWQAKSSPNTEVKSEFSKLVSSSSKSQRVKDMATKLFQSNNYQTI